MSSCMMDVMAMHNCRLLSILSRGVVARTISSEGSRAAGGDVGTLPQEGPVAQLRAALQPEP